MTCENECSQNLLSSTICENRYSHMPSYYQEFVLKSLQLDMNESKDDRIKTLQIVQTLGFGK